MLSRPPAATAAALLAAAAGVDGHGALVSPPSRNAVDRFFAPFLNGQSPQTPCTCPNAGHRDKNGDHGSLPCDQGARAGVGGQPCLWWSQGCTIGCDRCIEVNDTHSDGKRLCEGTLEPTLPKWAWTMAVGAKDGSPQDLYRYNPWRAPGSAPVVDPCGQAGGTPWAEHGGGGDAVYTDTQFAKFGDLGSKVLPYVPSGTKWLAGSSVEVGWAITYNHGGGYQYRLCPKDAELTEKCFQKTPLEFNRMKQALVWNNGTRYPIKGIWVDKGTSPAGSTWAMNPVPRVGEKSEGCLPNKYGCASFAPPCPQDCTGQANCTDYAKPTDPGTQQGECSGDWKGGQIVDTVIIPEDIAPGEYILGWRWDCEETTQIWQSCADVTICKPGTDCTAPPPYTPPPIPPTPAPASRTCTYGGGWVCKDAKCVAGTPGIDLPTCQMVCK